MHAQVELEVQFGTSVLVGCDLMGGCHPSNGGMMLTFVCGADGAWGGSGTILCVADEFPKKFSCCFLGHTSTSVVDPSPSGAYVY